MSGRTAARHDGVMAGATAAESEPLFSADDEGDDIIGQTESSNASKQNGHVSNMDAKVEDGGTGSHYPPPKYLKSTFRSREYEFDASDDIIEPEAEDGARDLPVMTGLLQTARSRGSVEVHRRRSGSASDNSLSPEDAALENGLIVGIGAAGGGILASVS